MQTHRLFYLAAIPATIEEKKTVRLGLGRNASSLQTVSEIFFFFVTY